MYKVEVLSFAVTARDEIQSVFIWIFLLCSKLISWECSLPLWWIGILEYWTVYGVELKLELEGRAWHEKKKMKKCASVLMVSPCECDPVGQGEEIELLHNPTTASDDCRRAHGHLLVLSEMPSRLISHLESCTTVWFGFISWGRTWTGMQMESSITLSLLFFPFRSHA